MYTVECHERFDFLAKPYQDLYGRSAATLFQHPIWLRRLYNSLAPTRHAAPAVLTVTESGSGRMVLTLPLLRRRVGGVTVAELADLGVCDYTTAVIDRAAAGDVVDDPHVRRDLQEAVGRVDVLRVGKLANTPVPASRLLEPANVVRLRYDTHSFPLPPSFDTWRGGLARDFVSHLDRKRKRLRPKGPLTLRELTDPDEIEDALLLMQDFRRSRFAQRRGLDLVQDPDCFNFYREVAKDSARSGGPGQTTVLELRGQTVAVSFGLADAERHLFLLVGYDYTGLRNYSLGLLIVEELVAAAIAAGRSTFDLTVGNEGYKAQFGARPAPMYAVRQANTLRGHGLRLGADTYLTARALAKRALLLSKQLAARS